MICRQLCYITKCTEEGATDLMPQKAYSVLFDDQSSSVNRLCIECVINLLT